MVRTRKASGAPLQILAIMCATLGAGATFAPGDVWAERSGASSRQTARDGAAKLGAMSSRRGDRSVSQATLRPTSKAMAGSSGVPASGAFSRKSFIGRGWFASVYRTPDGLWVVKSMRRRIAGGMAVTRAQRETMVRVTLEHNEKLRAAGLPVPETRAVPGRPDRLMQAYVSDGVTVDKLSGAAKTRALGEAKKLFRRAEDVIPEDPRAPVRIDWSEQNVLFDAQGNVKSWIDPVIPVDFVTHMTIQKQAKKK